MRKIIISIFCCSYFDILSLSLDNLSFNVLVIRCFVISIVFDVLPFNVLSVSP